MNPFEWINKHLHAGDSLIRKADGLRIVKCADAWHNHYIDGNTYFQLKTGTLHHVSEYILSTMSLADFFKQWEIKYAT